MQEHRSTAASSRFSRETDRSARVEPQPKRRHPEISWGDREVDGVRGKVERARPPLRNPILLEAQKLARQKVEAERRARESDSGAQLASAGDGAASTSRWDLDESNGARDDDKNDDARSKHSPIVWHSSGLTAAALAQAELERFKEHRMEMTRSESAVSEFVFRPSASPGSSPEEDAHILREGSVHPVQLADEAENDRSQVVGLSGITAQSAVRDTDSRMSPSSPALLRPGSFGECRSVDLYEKLNRISEGTYGVVYRARSTETGTICALKKVKLDKERDGFPLTAIREINILLSLQHPNIVGVSEVVVGNSLDSVFMVMEFGDHDLASVMRERMKQAFSIAEVKTLMRSLLSGVAYLHDNWVLHRDLKTSNILYTNGGELKICDFGLARQYGSPLKPYTRMVVTLWYRAPELLLGAKIYSTAVDIWSVGCIMGELLTREPLLAGKGEIDQLGKIFDLLGTPDEQSWPGLDSLPNFRKFNFRQARRSTLRQLFPPPGPVFDGRPILTEAGFDLLSRLLSLCPERRISAAEALRHPWFQEQPLPVDPMLMPTFPSTAVADGRRR